MANHDTMQHKNELCFKRYFDYFRNPRAARVAARVASPIEACITHHPPSMQRKILIRKRYATYFIILFSPTPHNCISTIQNKLRCVCIKILAHRIEIQRNWVIGSRNKFKRNRNTSIAWSLCTHNISGMFRYFFVIAIYI